MLVVLISSVCAAWTDPNVELPGNDENSWTTAEPGRLQGFSGGRFAIYRAHFEPFAAINVSGGKIYFAGITGKAEVWLDGKLAGKKDSFDAGALTMELPSGKGGRLLSVLAETKAESTPG